MTKTKTNSEKTRTLTLQPSTIRVLVADRTLAAAAGGASRPIFIQN